MALEWIVHFRDHTGVAPGDIVKVVGQVSDYNPDYHYKWDNNTLILAQSVELLSSGNAEFEPQVVSSAHLVSGSVEAEKYEGVLVKARTPR
jgi:predicted extracellular nuclease